MKDFLRLLAHDLQNQVGAIDLNLQVLPTLLPDTDPSYAKLSPFVERARRAAADLVSMLEDVQHYARTHEGSQEPTRLDLSSCVRDISLAMASLAASREIKLVTRITEGIFALAEAEAVRRSIKILMSEAMRSAFPGSTVEIAVTNAPVPMIEVRTSVEGIFDESRPTVATFLVREVLKASDVTILFPASAQILFKPA